MSALAWADAILRGQASNGAGAVRPSVDLARLGAVLVGCGLAYGAVMGSFGGVTGERAWQVAFSAAKVPLLLVVTFALSLPSFFVLNTLLGLRADFAAALRALATAQAGLTVVLLAMAPFTLLWYASSVDYPSAILFNAAMFAVASGSAQVVLRRAYRPLIARNARHRALLRLWLLLYAVVGIQMGWVLRPFLGAPDQPVTFFRAEGWDNAYVIVARMVWNVVLGR